MPSPRRARGRSERAGRPAIPDVIFAQASPRSLGGVSLFDAQGEITEATAPSFYSEAETVTRAVNRLRDAGFQILQVTQLTINIAANAQTYSRAFNTRIVAEERPTIKELGRVTSATFLDSPDTELSGLISTAGTQFEEVIEGVAIEEPRYLMAPSSFPPRKAYWHLYVPGGVSLGTNADRAHRTGITGKGVKVAMVDTGWYKHPYFVKRGYRVAPVVLGPAAANPLVDEVGHGTGESANIFAVAPDIELQPVKMSFVNSIAAFNAAAALKPDIITCSWASHRPFPPLSASDQALAAAVAAAVASGIIVIFAAGNGHAGFPGQHPDVVSAGGVFMNWDGALTASNYASGFMSNIYPNRRVPDLCGLVGLQPKAIYIMLPVQPGDQIDSLPWNDPSGDGLQGGTHPNGDETTSGDGWAAFSGTSAAAPQLAGVAALIKQACPKLTPASVRDIMMGTARDVTSGSCNTVPGIHTGLPAGPGHDTATGYGLVDAHKAVLVAKVRCLQVVPPGPAFSPPTPPPWPWPGVTPVVAPAVAPPVPPAVGPQPAPPVPPQTGPRVAVGREQGASEESRTAAGLSAEEVQALEELIVGGEEGQNI